MTYRLLNNGHGVILTREIEALGGDMHFKFLGACDGAVAIFSGPTVKLYKTLVNGKCTVPKEKITDSLSVEVIKYDGTVSPPRWDCEGIKLIRTDGGVLLCPDDDDVPSAVAELKTENHKLREDFEELEKKLELLQETYRSMMEGYDLT